MIRESIMVEVIAKHQNFKEAKKDTTYRQLKAVSLGLFLVRI